MTKRTQLELVNFGSALRGWDCIIIQKLYKIQIVNLFDRLGDSSNVYLLWCLELIDSECRHKLVEQTISDNIVRRMRW